MQPHYVPTSTLVGALYHLADIIDSPDGVPNETLRQAAQRLDELNLTTTTLLTALKTAHELLEQCQYALTEANDAYLHEVGYGAKHALVDAIKTHLTTTKPTDAA